MRDITQRRRMPVSLLVLTILICSRVYLANNKGLRRDNMRVLSDETHGLSDKNDMKSTKEIAREVFTLHRTRISEKIKNIREIQMTERRGRREVLLLFQREVVDVDEIVGEDEKSGALFVILEDKGQKCLNKGVENEYANGSKYHGTNQARALLLMRSGTKTPVHRCDADEKVEWNISAFVKEPREYWNEVSSKRRYL